jgi:hypothetical protein
MNQVAALFSFQETIKIEPRSKTLHEQMCFIADEVVRYNMSDVAVHDARILRRMRKGETRLWIINELGSQFLPMYCKLLEAARQEDKDYVLSAVEVTVARLLRDDPFDKARQKQFLDSAQFYFITKGAGAYDGSIDSVDFRDVVHLVYCGDANHLVN